MGSHYAGKIGDSITIWDRSQVTIVNTYNFAAILI
jgi:hypothetical protein